LPFTSAPTGHHSWLTATSFLTGEQVLFNLYVSIRVPRNHANKLRISNTLPTAKRAQRSGYSSQALSSWRLPLITRSPTRLTSRSRYIHSPSNPCQLAFCRSTRTHLPRSSCPASQVAFKFRDSAFSPATQSRTAPLPSLLLDHFSHGSAAPKTH